ncbi:MFS transporter [Lacticaseibacillus zhaodongensis]|uniref:MFS transporter n=1 Tax=Lacticaseibacillus zhaodongensis TaxID=2668065 RepID=UPI0012D2A8E4|nr:MFS transporter [Lacticaseibacillus zhaodongensis]
MEQTKNKKFGIVLPIILISYFMILLDNAIVYTSSVKLAQDLSLNAQTLSWVSNAYALTFGGMILLGGRAGDVFGRQEVFLLGLVIFSAASLLVGMSVNGAMLISMRAVQGIGAAILAPTTLALLIDSYAGSMRTRAIVYYGATGGLGGSVGLIIGGLIASYFSWRIGFLINGPVGIVLFILAKKFIPRSKRARGTIDWSGAILSVLGIVAIIYGINGATYPVPTIVLGVLLIVVFIWQEQRTAEPLMPLVLFKNRERSSAYLARFFFLGAMTSYFFLTPQVMQSVDHYTPLMAAVAFLLQTLPQFISATAVSRLNKRFSNTQIMIVGTFITMLGILWAAITKVQSGFLLGLAVPMVILGIGQGLAMSTLTVAGVANTTPDIAGSASGVVNTMHQVGSSAGLAVITMMTAGLSNPVIAYNHSLAIMFVFMVVALFATINVAFAKK